MTPAADDSEWMFYLGVYFSVILAVSIGANSAANLCGVVYGTKSMTFRKIFVILFITRAIGTLVMSFQLSEVKIESVVGTGNCIEFNGTKDELMETNIAIIAGSSLWLLYCTLQGLPVSATHSIIGAELGYYIKKKGILNVKWAHVFRQYFLIGSAGLIILTSLITTVSYHVFSRTVTKWKERALKNPGLIWWTSHALEFGVLGSMFIFISYTPSALINFDKKPMYIIMPPVVRILLGMVMFYVWEKTRKTMLRGPPGVLRGQPGSFSDEIKMALHNCLGFLENIIRICIACSLGFLRKTIWSCIACSMGFLRNTIWSCIACKRNRCNMCVWSFKQDDNKIHALKSYIQVEEPCDTMESSDQGFTFNICTCVCHLSRNKYSMNKCQYKQLPVNAGCNEGQPALSNEEHVPLDLVCSTEQEKEQKCTDFRYTIDIPQTSNEKLRDRWFTRLTQTVVLFSCFAYGGHDVSNSVSSVFVMLKLTYQSKAHLCQEKISFIVLFLGFLVISLGVRKFGKIVMKTVGELVTLEPISGFCVEMSTVYTIFTYSHLFDVPISITYCKVVAMTSVGVVDRSLKWSLFWKLLLFWVLTIPASAVISGIISSIVF